MSKAAGTRRERQVVAAYRDDGWVAFRTPASLGVCDVVAMRRCETFDGDYAEVVFAEVKANVGSPYKSFLRLHREALRLAALVAGATPLLVHWPPHGKRRDYGEAEWPR